MGLHNKQTGQVEAVQRLTDIKIEHHHDSKLALYFFRFESLH